MQTVPRPPSGFFDDLDDFMESLDVEEFSEISPKANAILNSVKPRFTIGLSEEELNELLGELGPSAQIPPPEPPRPEPVKTPSLTVKTPRSEVISVGIGDDELELLLGDLNELTPIVRSKQVKAPDLDHTQKTSGIPAKSISVSTEFYEDEILTPKTQSISTGSPKTIKATSEFYEDDILPVKSVSKPNPPTIAKTPTPPSIPKKISVSSEFYEDEVLPAKPISSPKHSITVKTPTPTNKPQQIRVSSEFYEDEILPVKPISPPKQFVTSKTQVKNAPPPSEASPPLPKIPRPTNKTNPNFLEKSVQAKLGSVFTKTLSEPVDRMTIDTGELILSTTNALRDIARPPTTLPTLPSLTTFISYIQTNCSSIHRCLVSQPYRTLITSKSSLMENFLKEFNQTILTFFASIRTNMNLIFDVLVKNEVWILCRKITADANKIVELAGRVMNVPDINFRENYEKEWVNLVEQLNPQFSISALDLLKTYSTKQLKLEEICGKPIKEDPKKSLKQLLLSVASELNQPISQSQISGISSPYTPPADQKTSKVILANFVSNLARDLKAPKLDQITFLIDFVNLLKYFGVILYFFKDRNLEIKGIVKDLIFSTISIIEHKIDGEPEKLKQSIISFAQSLKSLDTALNIVQTIPCSRCGLGIEPSNVNHVAGKNFHFSCFSCEVCGIRLVEYFIVGGKFYCPEHATGGQSCKKCKKPVSVQFYEISVGVFHNECFVCNQCNIPLGEDFYIKNGMPHCKRHRF